MRYIPDNNLSYPVLIKLENGSSGSGFYLEIDNVLYLITARHVLFEIKENRPSFSLISQNTELISYPDDIKITEPIILSVNLAEATKNNLVRFNPDIFEADIALIKIGAIQPVKNTRFFDVKLENSVVINNKKEEAKIVWATKSYLKPYNDVLISNEVLLFGYPNSLGRGDQINPLKPLLRKGIVAGKNDGKKTIILDCPVYYGNSGGLVLEIEEMEGNKKAIHCIGIVSQFVPFDEKLISLQHKTINTNVENSGYSIVVPTDSILDIIKK